MSRAYFPLSLVMANHPPWIDVLRYFHLLLNSLFAGAHSWGNNAKRGKGVGIPLHPQSHSRHTESDVNSCATQLLSNPTKLHSLHRSNRVDNHMRKKTNEVTRLPLCTPCTPAPRSPLLEGGASATTSSVVRWQNVANVPKLGMTPTPTSCENVLGLRILFILTVLFGLHLNRPSLTPRRRSGFRSVPTHWPRQALFPGRSWHKKEPRGGGEIWAGWENAC